MISLHTKHGVLFQIVLTVIDTDQTAKVEFIDTLLVLVDPVSPFLLGLGSLEMLVVKVLDIDLGESSFKVFIDFIVDPWYNTIMLDYAHFTILSLYNMYLLGEREFTHIHTADQLEICLGMVHSLYMYTQS